ncbi:MAG: hypothetical protein R3E95_17615 [Thiolinea sp.]
MRGAQLNAEHPMTSALQQLTLNWASPIQVNADHTEGREVSELLHSSAASWASEALNVLPDYQRYPDSGFEPGSKRAAQLLAVAEKGRFTSFFKGKDSPLLDKEAPEADQPLAEQTATEAEADKTAEDKAPVVSSVIEKSSDSARLVLIASNMFATDASIDLASQGQGSLYTRPLEFIQNAIDWSLDDQGLLGIRSRAQLARTLNPMTHGVQLFWEYLNYALALLGLVLVWGWRTLNKRKKQALYTQWLAEV